MSKFKKSMAILVSAAVALSLGAGFSVSAAGSGDNTNTPHTIFVTFYGDAHTSRGFAWSTDKTSLLSQVEIGTKSDLSDAEVVKNTASGNTYSIKGGDRTDGTTDNANLIEYGHKVVVSNLKADTKYYYKVGDTGAAGGMSTLGSFTTEGSSNSFSFIDVTDTQASVYATGPNDANGKPTVTAADLTAANADYTKNWAPMLAKAFKTVTDASFVMDNGDITENGGDLKQWNLFAGSAAANLMNTTIMPITGNHETYNAHDENAVVSIANSFSGYDATAFKAGAPTAAESFGICGPIQGAITDHFNLDLPSSSSESADQLKSGAYYSFDYGNAHIMVLNTNDQVPASTYSADGKTEKPVGGTLSDAQVSWLTANAAASTQKWKIVLFHRAVQSIGSHVADADVQALRAQILPLMAKDNIDLVLQGHDHTYLRSKIINASANPVNFPEQITENYNGVSTKFDVNAAGSIYVIPGASDNKFYASSAKIPANVFPDVTNPPSGGSTLDLDNDPAGGKEASEPTYAAVKVDGERLTVTTYQYKVSDKSQKVIDTFALAKPDAQTALVSKIAALPAVDSLTISDTAAVKAAYDQYNALDPIDQVMVTNSDVLLNDVNLIQQIEPDASNTSTSPNPKTGSSQSDLPFILLGFLSAGVVSILLVFRKKLVKHN